MKCKGNKCFYCDSVPQKKHSQNTINAYNYLLLNNIFADFYDTPPFIIFQMLFDGFHFYIT